MTPEQARRAIALLDLTDLADDCTPDDVEQLCGRASRWETAAVCVWPDFVAQAAGLLATSGVRVATVVNFPTGDERPYAVAAVTGRVLADGADEIDVVLPYRRFLAGDAAWASAVLDAVRATVGARTVKVILETGELPGTDAIERATRFAIDHGADFVKTSTGKSPVSATVEAAEAMLRVIAGAGRPVGIKPSGGIATAGDAARYLGAAEAAMGRGWVSPATFRIGTSRLLDALLAAAGE